MQWLPGCRPSSLSSRAFLVLAVVALIALTPHHAAAQGAGGVLVAAVSVHGCSDEPLLHSVDGQRTINLNFVNRAMVGVAVYWLGYDGQRVSYKWLEPGESYTQPTYATHPWLVIDNA